MLCAPSSSSLRQDNPTLRMLSRLLARHLRIMEASELTSGPIDDAASNLRMQIEVRGLRDGHVFTLEGIPTGKQFFVIFQSKVLNTRPFHLDFEFNKNRIQMWSMIDGTWEETESRKLPIKRGKAFKVVIMTTSNCFRVVIDGAWTTCYDFRMGNEEVEFIQVFGDIVINQRDAFLAEDVTENVQETAAEESVIAEDGPGETQTSEAGNRSESEESGEIF